MLAALALQQERDDNLVCCSREVGGSNQKV